MIKDSFKNKKLKNRNERLSKIKGVVTAEILDKNGRVTHSVKGNNIVTISGQETLKSNFGRFGFSPIINFRGLVKGLTVKINLDTSPAPDIDDYIYSALKYVILYQDDSGTYTAEYTDKYPPFYDCEHQIPVIDTSKVLGVGAYHAIDAGTGMYGILNTTESEISSDKIKLVYEFGTGQANGTISHVMFTGVDYDEWVGNNPFEIITNQQTAKTDTKSYLMCIARKYGTQEYYIFPTKTDAPTTIRKYDASTDTFSDTGITPEFTYSTQSSLYYAKDAVVVGDYIYYTWKDGLSPIEDEDVILRNSLIDGTQEIFYNKGDNDRFRGITYNGSVFYIVIYDISTSVYKLYTLDITGTTLTLVGEFPSGTIIRGITLMPDNDTLYYTTVNDDTNGLALVKVSISDLTSRTFEGSYRNKYISDIQTYSLFYGRDEISICNDGENILTVGRRDANNMTILKFRKDLGILGSSFKLPSPVIKTSDSSLKLTYELIYDV